MRRAVLVAALAAMSGGAARRVHASTPTDVELSGDAGQASGGWVCGPMARVRYAGGGAVVRVHPLAEPRSDAREGAPANASPGFAVTAGGAAEYHSYELVSCPQNDCSGDGARVPPAGLVGAGTLSVGYDDARFGAHGGALLWQRYRANADTHASVSWLPQLQVRFGRVDRLQVHMGLGSYDVATLLRPGGYVGLVSVPSPGWECAVHAGMHEIFDGNIGPRVSLGFKAPVADRLQVGLVLAGSVGPSNEVDPEGQLVLGLHL